MRSLIKKNKEDQEKINRTVDILQKTFSFSKKRTSNQLSPKLNMFVKDRCRKNQTFYSHSICFKTPKYSIGFFECPSISQNLHLDVMKNKERVKTTGNDKSIEKGNEKQISIHNLFFNQKIKEANDLINNDYKPCRTSNFSATNSIERSKNAKFRHRMLKPQEGKNYTDFDFIITKLI